MTTAPDGMTSLPSGTFRMGSDAFYPEERPVREMHVEAFWIDQHPVTVAEFRRFVKDTGYVTRAERALEPTDYPDADPTLLVPGSLVFHRTPGPVPLDDYRAWWRYIPGASWERPEGPGSDTYTRARHPVVHVTHEDAAAYAAWVGKALPNEAEWEYAARGGLDGATYCWGEEFMPDGRLMANTWHGQFPHQYQRPDPWLGTSPVKTYPANGFGIHDLAGNVWEWTDDAYEALPAARPCCGPEPSAHIPRKVIKGGSHLCAPNYCLRYRPAARQGEAIDTSTGHIGFRCIMRAA